MKSSMAEKKFVMLACGDDHMKHFCNFVFNFLNFLSQCSNKFCDIDSKKWFARLGKASNWPRQILVKLSNPVSSLKLLNLNCLW
jgi:hypothetical protein